MNDQQQAQQHSDDPELYQRRVDCTDVPSRVLMTAYEAARITYYRCGGHWRAARMEAAMRATSDELLSRGIYHEPYSSKDVVRVTWKGKLPHDD